MYSGKKSMHSQLTLRSSLASTSFTGGLRRGCAVVTNLTCQLSPPTNYGFCEKTDFCFLLAMVNWSNFKTIGCANRDLVCMAGVSQYFITHWSPVTVLLKSCAMKRFRQQRRASAESMAAWPREMGWLGGYNSNPWELSLEFNRKHNQQLITTIGQLTTYREFNSPNIAKSKSYGWRWD